VILDRFIPPNGRRRIPLWIDPPVMGSPIPVRTTVEQAAFTGWDADHPGAAGLHTKDFKLDRAKVFEAAPGDGRIGEVAAGAGDRGAAGQAQDGGAGLPPGAHRDALRTGDAAVVRQPAALDCARDFRRYEISGGSVGAVKLVMDQDTAAADVKVTADDGSALPFTMRERTLNFFSGAPGGVKVVAGTRVPLLADAARSCGSRSGRSRRRASRGAALRADSGIVDRSVALAGLAGGFGLLAEWVLYGRFRRGMMRAKTMAIRAETTGGPIMKMPPNVPFTQRRREHRGSAEKTATSCEQLPSPVA